MPTSRRPLTAPLSLTGPETRGVGVEVTAAALRRSSPYDFFATVTSGGPTSRLTAGTVFR